MATASSSWEPGWSNTCSQNLGIVRLLGLAWFLNLEILTDLKFLELKEVDSRSIQIQDLRPLTYPV